MAFINSFTGLFSSSDACDIDSCLHLIERRVTESMNKELLKPFSREEICHAIHHMGPLKAPGPDGFPVIFFQKNWSLLGDDSCCVVLSTLNSGSMPIDLNMTNIALIPKVKNPTCVSKFRPISLCNVLYKVILKVLANRLKKILPSIISPEQSAFILERLITDNVLAVYETLQTMQTQLKEKKGFMAVKLDISKAYDRMEWKYLEEIMKRLGFDTRWINLILMCVTSVRYSILVNGKPCGLITPQRGLRQRDPISPYLFLLCAEGLNALLKKAMEEGMVTGASMSIGDDSLLFCRSTLAQWNNLSTILNVYEKASGQ